MPIEAEAQAQALYADEGLRSGVSTHTSSSASQSSRAIRCRDVSGQLDWPFFEDRHRALDRDVRSWVATRCRRIGSATSTGVPRVGACARWRRVLASLRARVVRRRVAGVDSRSLCLMRERLAEQDGLADFLVRDAGLGQWRDLAEGSEAQRQRWFRVWRAVKRWLHSRCRSRRPAPT